MYDETHDNHDLVQGIEFEQHLTVRRTEVTEILDGDKVVSSMSLEMSSLNSDFDSINPHLLNHLINTGVDEAKQNIRDNKLSELDTRIALTALTGLIPIATTWATIADDSFNRWQNPATAVAVAWLGYVGWNIRQYRKNTGETSATAQKQNRIIAGLKSLRPTKMIVPHED